MGGNCGFGVGREDPLRRSLEIGDITDKVWPEYSRALDMELRDGQGDIPS